MLTVWNHNFIGRFLTTIHYFFFTFTVENELTDASVVKTEDCKPLVLQDVSSIKTEIIDDSSTDNKDILRKF